MTVDARWSARSRRDQVVAVARARRDGRARPGGAAPTRRAARADRRTGRDRSTRLRRLDWVRLARHDLHRARGPSEPPASLIRSHAAGIGDEVESEVVRAMMCCRLRTL